MTSLTEPSFILLDIDGVLNRHTRHSNGYCGIDPECVANFNHVLGSVPEAKICVISAWRYDVHAGRLTIPGIASLLLTHGVACHGRIIGVTESDEAICGHVRSYDWLKVYGGHARRTQIWRWLYGVDMPLFPCGDDRQWCVLDDLDLGFLPEYRWRHVRTDGETGLTVADADRAIAVLKGEAQ